MTGKREELIFRIDGVGGKVGGQVSARGVDGGLHIAGSAVDIAAEVELESDRADPKGAGGGHLRNSGDVAELAFQRSGHGGGHYFRAGAGQGGSNGDGCEIDLGQGRNGQIEEGEHARKRDSRW